MSNKNQPHNKSQLDHLMVNVNIERERKNEAQYFEKFIDLVKQKKSR